jgi:hypothetical protein
VDVADFGDFFDVPMITSRGHARPINTVTFTAKAKQMYFNPTGVDLGNRRVTWQENGSGILRLRFTEHGRQLASKVSATTMAASTGSLMRHLGRDLQGDFPVVRRDADALYIDIR